MRALGLAVLLLLLVAPGARAADRLDALAAALRDGPLAVDPELSWLLDARQERRLTRVLERSSVPFHVALLPQFEDDESGGDGDRIAWELQRRVGRPGIYLAVDQSTYLHGRADDVGRRIEVRYGLETPPPDGEPSGAELVARLTRLVATAEAAPPGDRFPASPPSPVRPYREPLAPPDEPTTGELAGGMAILGAGAGFAAGLVMRGLTWHRRRRRR